MQCWRCGRPVREGAKVCIHCGARLSDPPQPARDDRRAARRPLEEERPSSSRGGRTYDEPDDSDDQEIERPPRSSRPRNRDDDRRPDPLADPRAPNALRRSGPPPSPPASRGGPGRGGRANRADRPQRSDPPAERYDGQRRGAGGYGRGGRERDAGRAYDREPPSGRGSYQRDPHERGGGRTSARNQDRDPRLPTRQQDSAEYETPSAEYDAALSAEYSAAYSTELSAESSAEYNTEDSAEYGAARGYRGQRRGYPEDDPYAGGRGRGRGTGGDARRRRGVYPEAAPASAGYGSWEARALATAGAGEGGEGWSAGWQAAEARPAKKKRRSGGVIVAVLLLLVVAALGAGFAKRDAILGRLGPGSPTASAFATYTPGPTPTAPAQYKQFVSPKGQYILAYPQAWTVKSDSTPSGGQPDYVDTFNQATPAVVVAVEQAQIFNTLSDADAIAAEIRAAQQKGYTFTPSGTPTTVNVGGEQWQRQEYDSTTNGVKLHYAVLSAHHLGRSYVIVLVALPGDFAKENASAFPTILKSFRFTS